MLSMAHPPAPSVSPARRLASLLKVTLGTIVFLVVVGIVSKGLRLIADGRVANTLRTRATLAIGGSALGEIVVLILLVVFLRLRRRSLRDLGLWRPAPLRGWLVAAIVTALYLVMTLGALRGRVAWSDFSAFRIYNALIAGITAGFVEETFFRGFVMSELKWSGFGAVVQR